MALSDYVTSDEWDACFYVWRAFGIADLGSAMRSTIQHVSAKGYEFRGVTPEGRKLQQVANDNPKKLVALIGGENPALLIKCFENGREFLKRHDPELVRETDDEWAEALAELKKRHNLT